MILEKLAQFNNRVDELFASIGGNDFTKVECRLALINIPDGSDEEMVDFILKKRAKKLNYKIKKSLWTQGEFEF